METNCKVFPSRSLPNKSKDQVVQNGVVSCGTINFISMELNGSLEALLPDVNTEDSFALI